MRQIEIRAFEKLQKSMKQPILSGGIDAMGMDSSKLSARVKQPGHDRTFRRSEVSFIDVAQRSLGHDYDVVANPKDLREIFGKVGERALGISPEASITSKVTGRKFFVEVKKQGPAGNAEERACKHHTVQFYKTLHNIYKYDYHPYVTIFCECLAEMERYTRKAMYLFEEGQYFLWKDYNETALANFLQGRCRAWLDKR
jgi:hypothetical protein